MQHPSTCATFINYFIFQLTIWTDNQSWLVRMSRAGHILQKENETNFRTTKVFLHDYYAARFTKTAHYCKESGDILYILIISFSKIIKKTKQNKTATTWKWYSNYNWIIFALCKHKFRKSTHCLGACFCTMIQKLTLSFLSHKNFSLCALLCMKTPSKWPVSTERISIAFSPQPMIWLERI